MDHDQSMEEILCDLDKPTMAPYKILGDIIKTVYWCNFKKLDRKRGLQFYQTRSHAIDLYNTLLAVCNETAVCMKTKEELYHKVCLSPRLPRVVLKANSQSGHQDQQEQDARTSCDHPRASQTSRETWCNNVDCRIPGILQSNNRTRIAETQSKSLFSSSRATRTRSLSCRT